MSEAFRLATATALCFLHAAPVLANTIHSPQSTPMNTKVASSKPTRVAFETPYGRIVAEVYTDRAPVTSANFLRYVDEGRYKNATFYRAVRHDNDPRTPKIKVIQGGIDPTCENPPLPPVPHESTKVTGLSHTDGALSAVPRDSSTTGSEFFFINGDTPELDFGGARNPVGHGFAMFGRVVEGMDVVRKINAGATGIEAKNEFLKLQGLKEPVPVKIERVP